MKLKLKETTKQRLKRYGKSSLSLILAASLVLGNLYFGKSDASANEPVLSMPSFQDFHIMPKAISENGGYYRYFDNAEDCSWSVTNDAIDTCKSGGYTLPYREFWGRAYIIYRSPMSEGRYALNVKLGPVTGYNKFKQYSQASQLSSRIVYQNSRRPGTSMWENVDNYIQPTGTFKSDWNNMTVIGNCMYVIHDVMVILADLNMPKVDNFITGVLDGEPVIWMNCGEKLRPSNYSITESMFANMRLSVELKPKLEKNSNSTVTAIFKATEIDMANGIIGFTAVNQSELETAKSEIPADKQSGIVLDNVISSEVITGDACTCESADKCICTREWAITSISDISIKDTYKLITSANADGEATNTVVDNLTVQWPITDMAGNPVELKDKITYEAKNYLMLDACPPKIVSTSLTGSVFDNVSEEKLKRPDYFTGLGDDINISLNVSEEVNFVEGKSMADVYLKWAIGEGENQTIVESKLTGIVRDYATNNTNATSVLTFEPLVITEGMAGNIILSELVGCEYLVDSSNNPMSNDLSKAYLKRQIGVDAEGPTVSIVGEPVISNSNDGGKYYIYKLRFSDGDVEGSPVFNGAGVIKGDNPVNQSALISSNNQDNEVKWKLAVSDSATLNGFLPTDLSKHSNVSVTDFTLPTNTGSYDYYLHLYVNTTDNNEINNDTSFYVDFNLEDAKGNKSETRAITINQVGIDKKAPTIEVNALPVEVVRADNSNSAVTFSANVKATDVNGVKAFFYKWTDVSQTEAPADNEWIQVGDNLTVTLSENVSYVDNEFAKKLWVKAIDNSNNETIYSSTEGDFIANVSRANARYELIDDITKPGAVNDVKILPSVIDSVGTKGGVTRATVVMGDKIYVRIFDFRNSSTEKLLLDKDAADWYLVELDDAGNNYTSVTAGVKPEWDTYYGVINVKLDASTVDLTPNMSTPSVIPDGDTTYQGLKGFEVLYTCKRDGVHNITSLKVMNKGIEMTPTTSDYGNYYKMYQSIDGVTYDFEIGNTILSSLNASDVDFANSYAVLMNVDAEGQITTAATANIPLSVGSTQSISIPSKTGGYDSGAYALVVHLVQLSGGVQDITFSDYILLDNDKLPERFGITEYSNSVYIGYGGDKNRDTIDLGSVAEDGEIISSIKLGIGESSEEEEIVYIDGKPAFTKISSNSLNSAGEIRLVLRADTSGKQFLGQTLGKVAGMRIWNQASVGDSSSLAWNTEENVFYSFEERSELRLFPNLDSKSEDSIVVDKDTLVTTDISDFKLAIGRNVVCYQLIMENGRISPVYTFDINIYDETPSIELSYKYGNMVTSKDYIYEDNYYYPIMNETYDRIYSDSIAINIDNAYSPNGELKAWRATFNESEDEYVQNDWVYEQVDPSKPIEIFSYNTNGYAGLNGTLVGVSGGQRYADEIDEYYIFMDEVGNAQIYFPIVTTEYSTAKGHRVDGNVDYVTDEYGNTWCSAIAADSTSPIMYYFTKSDYVGSMDVYNSLDTDGVTQKIGFSNRPIETLDQVSITIDDGEEVVLETLESYVAGFNQAGIVRFDGNTLYYVFSYDDTKAEGEVIDHTVVIKGYINGEIAKDIEGNQAIKELTISAPNYKPELVQNGTPDIGKGYVKSSTYLYAAGMTENKLTGDFAAEFTVPMYEDGKFTQIFYDKYGKLYELSVDIEGMPTDISVKLSETDTTANPVDVTITSQAGSLEVGSSSNLPTGATMTGVATSKLVVTMPDNGDIEVICTYSDGSSKTVYVTVSNINNKPISPVIYWDYNEFKVDSTDNSYEGEVVAVLIDENGSVLIDLSTGTVPTYTFTPGGQTTYVFDNYINDAGVAGEPVEAVLPVTLKGVVTETTEKDTYKPDVAITGHAKFMDDLIELEGAFMSVDSTRPGFGTAEQIISVPDYKNIYGDELVYSDMNKLMSQTSFAERFVFNMDIADENDVKIFIKSDKHTDIPTYKDGESDVVEGVSVVGRMLQISTNTEFALHVVDSNNNATSIYFNVTNLGDTPPAPTVTEVLTKTGDEVRVYLTYPELEGVTDLAITSQGSAIENDVTSEFYGMPYMAYTKNYPDGVTIFYTYKLNGKDVTGSVVAYVTGIDVSLPAVVDSKWSANYDKTGTRYTNQNITLQLEFNKALSEVYLADASGNRVMNSRITVAYIDNRVTVIFSDNTEPVYLRFTDAVIDDLTTSMLLPAITTIDKIPAVITASKEYNERHNQAIVTFISNENMVWPDGRKGMEYSFTVKENGDYTVSVADMAGNNSSKNISINDLILEELKIDISTSASDNTIIDPVTYQVDVGDKLYVRVNRTSTLTTTFDDVEIDAIAGTWIEIELKEDVEGLYPGFNAIDEYGNTAWVNLLEVPIKDRKAPTIMVQKNIISVSEELTLEQIEEKLRGNIVVADETTSLENLKVTFELPAKINAGTHMVTYCVEDEAGNKATASCYLRVYSGVELIIELNGEKVENDETICVTAGTQTITIKHNGEPYKVDWRQGIRSLGQMKNDANSLIGYVSDNVKTTTIELTKAGYYTFLVTTQGRETYRFVLYVEE